MGDNVIMRDSGTSSIKVSKNASNKFAFEVKLYFDKDEEDEKDIVRRITNIHLDLKSKFRE